MCQTFIDFWDDDVVIQRSYLKRSHALMVIWLTSEDLIIVKVHLMMALVDMALNFGIYVETQYSLFVLRCRRLQWSFSLALIYKIALSAIDFVHHLRWWTVGCILLLRTWKNAVDVFFSAFMKPGYVDVLINDQFFQRQRENTETQQNLSMWVWSIWRSTLFHTYW